MLDSDNGHSGEARLRSRGRPSGASTASSTSRLATPTYDRKVVKDMKTMISTFDQYYDGFGAEPECPKCKGNCAPRIEC